MPLADPQPKGVQVVEGVVSFPFSFEYFTFLATVFAEEVGDFGEIVTDGKI